MFELSRSKAVVPVELIDAVSEPQKWVKSIKKQFHKKMTKFTHSPVCATEQMQQNGITDTYSTNLFPIMRT